MKKTILGAGQQMLGRGVREGLSEETALQVKEDPVTPTTKGRMFQIAD